MKANDRSLPDWCNRIRTGQLQLPRFQRNEAWGPSNVLGLLQSVVDGLPTGAALVLEVGEKPPFVCRAIVGTPAPTERCNEQLLDGQQRLTAMWRSLHDGYIERSYFVAARPDGEGTHRVSVQSRYIRNGKRMPLWPDSPKECWDRGLIPVQVLRPDAAAEGQRLAWQASAAGGDPHLQIEIMTALAALRERFLLFNLPFLALPAGTKPDVALNVFLRMNTGSVPLGIFDIVTGQYEAANNESLHDYIDSISAAAPALSAYVGLRDLILNAAALLQDRSPNVSGVMGLNLATLKSDYDRLASGAQRAVELLRSERILDGARLPTEVVLAPLVALLADAPAKLDAKGNADKLLRKYLWRAFLTDRYERAAATAAQQDYRALRGLIAGTDPKAQVPCFDGAVHALPTPEEYRAAGWPKPKDRLARAVLAMSLRFGAKDIADRSEVSETNVTKREYHHLFPVAHLAEQKLADGTARYSDDDVFRALNCALVSWESNRHFSCKAPVDYLLERCTKAQTLGADGTLKPNLAEDEIRRRLITHLIDYDAMIKGDYDAFLTHRAGVMAEVAGVLAEGEDPSLAGALKQPA